MRIILTSIAMTILFIAIGVWIYLNPTPPKTSCVEWVKITSPHKIEYKCLKEEQIK